MMTDTILKSEVTMTKTAKTDVELFISSLISELEESLKREAALELECEHLKAKIIAINLKMERLIISTITTSEPRYSATSRYSGHNKRYVWS